jgi:hypothetical protein
MRQSGGGRFRSFKLVDKICVGTTYLMDLRRLHNTVTFEVVRCRDHDGCQRRSAGFLQGRADQAHRMELRS